MHALIFSFNPPDLHTRNSGGHRIATHLRSNGWDIEVIDFAELWSLEELKEIAKKRITSKTKFFGISQFSIDNYEGSIAGVEFMGWVKKKYPHIKIILGSQQIDKMYPHVDYIISGYAEVSIITLLKYLFGNSLVAPKMRESKGIIFIDSQIDYKAHPWNDCSIIYEDRDYIVPNEFGVTEFSRGCKFSCKFCTTTILGVKEKTIRDVEIVKKELLHNYDKYGIQNYYICDPTFNTETEKMIAYADLVETLPFTSYFSGFIRPDLLIKRKRDREELLRMGFLGHFYGVESFEKKTARYIGKGNPDMIKEGLLEIKDFFTSKTDKYRGHINLIAGLPYESKESLYSTKDWIEKNWQGQSARMEALELELEDHPFRSQLSKEYKEIGYRDSKKTISDMPNEEMKGIFRQLEMVRKFRESVIDEENKRQHMKWENDYMDIYEASSIASKLNGVFTLKNGFNTMKLNSDQMHQLYCDSDGNPLTLEKKLNLIYGVRDKFVDNFKNIFVRNYINKKLS
jgi:radical SAM superfamily enzyme YgiQ (UPF0313 family)